MMLPRSMKELGAQYASRALSPVEVTREVLERIRSRDAYNAFILVTEESALQQARAAEARMAAREDVGPLLGVPISHKDLIDTKGITTTNGASFDKKRVPPRDADVVKQLATAGAVSLGKTNLHEYAFGITSENPFYGDVRNPWDTRLIAGGSSGGSGAAVAASFGLGSTGTDTGGSIRIPASCCGVAGLKPTRGLVSTAGVTPLSWSLDHTGPMAGTVGDVALMMRALTGRRYPDEVTGDLKGLRVGVPVDYFTERVDPQVQGLYRRAVASLQDLGAIPIEVSTPFAQHSFELTTTIAAAEAGYVHHDRMQASMSGFGEDVRAVLQQSRSISSYEYIEALQHKERITEEVSDLLGTVDVIATPTTPLPAVEIGTEEVELWGVRESVFACMLRFTCLFDLSGHPALSVPCGTTDSSRPVGLQLVANHHREDLLLRVGLAYEDACLREFYAKRRQTCVQE